MKKHLLQADLLVDDEKINILVGWCAWNGGLFQSRPHARRDVRRTPPRLTNRGSLTALLHSPGPRRPATRNFSARTRRSSAKRDSSRDDHTARSDIMLLGYFQNKAESH